MAWLLEMAKGGGALVPRFDIEKKQSQGQPKFRSQMDTNRQAMKKQRSGHRHLEKKDLHLEKPKWYFLHYYTLLYKKNAKNAIWNKQFKYFQ